MSYRKHSYAQITETFSFSHKKIMKRRDGRQGDQMAQPALPLHRGVAIVMDWPPPLAGHLEDLFTLEGFDGSILHCRSRINVEGRTNETLQVRWIIFSQKALCAIVGRNSSSGMYHPVAAGSRSQTRECDVVLHRLELMIIWQLCRATENVSNVSSGCIGACSRTWCPLLASQNLPLLSSLAA